jgi:hypothetical protein
VIAGAVTFRRRAFREKRDLTSAGLSGWILGCIRSTRELEEIDPTAKTPL